MELTAIALARVVAFLDVQTLDPLGRATALEIFERIGSKYSFSKTPQTLAEIDFQTGVELATGRLDGISIDKMVFYGNGVVIDTRSSTDECEKVLHDLLGLAKDAFGATVRPTRVNFVSQIIFRSNLRLTLLNPLLQPVADRLKDAVSRDLGQSVDYEPTAVIWAPDLSQIKLTPAGFSIERRAEAPFSENTYFSNAPLRTTEHLEMVKRIEASLLPRS